MSRRVPLITVLTPAYNRRDTLGRLYHSLCVQTFREFEWVIVDDGSEDDTEGLVRAWIAAGELDIHYMRQPNRGKHVAVNRGVELARGELTAIIDSDDRYVPNALEILVRRWNTIPVSERTSFSGLRALCAFEDGRIVGDRYPVDPLDCDPAELTHVYGIMGDKPILLRTNVLREFPFPFEDLRGLVTEALVWHRMALKYRERHVNEVVVIVEYRKDGMSDRALELLIRAAPATRQYFLEEARLPHRVRLRRRLRSHVNYVRYSLHSATSVRDQVCDAPSKIAWLALAPLGLALYFRDRRRLVRRGSRPPQLSLRRRLP